MILFCVGLILFLILLLHILIPKQYNWPSVEWKINKIPGPASLPYFGNVLVFLGPNEEYLPKILTMAKTYKPILRAIFLGVPQVLCTDVDEIEVIMNSKQHITKSLDYNLLLPWLGTGLLTSTGQKWFNHRKWLTPAFHFGILEPYIEVFNKHASTLVDQLRTSVKGTPVEINPAITLCTLDIICETAMGTQVNAQLGGEKEYVKATLRMSQLFQIRQLRPWLYREWVFKMTPTGREQKKVLNTLHGFTEKVIKERRELFRKEHLEGRKDEELELDVIYGAKKRMSFLDLLIEISEKENKLTSEEIREEVDTFMFEGHDTTSAAICWVLFELSQNQDVQEKAYQELNDIFNGSDRAPNQQDLQEMKYLERIIKEALRLYPSVPLISRQLEDDIKLCGYEVPAGTNVPILIYAIHRDPKYWPEPEKFNPDRFLPDAIQGRHPYSYIPFSAGPRNCIGQKFAMMEEKVILSAILRNFKMTAMTKPEDIKLMAELILRPKDNIKLYFEPRQTNQSIGQMK